MCHTRTRTHTRTHTRAYTRAHTRAHTDAKHPGATRARGRSPACEASGTAPQVLCGEAPDRPCVPRAATRGCAGPARLPAIRSVTDCAVGSGWWAEPPYPPWALHRRGPGRPILGGFGGGPERAPGPPKNRPGRVPRIYALKGGLRGHRTLTAIGLTMHMSDNDMVMMMPLASSLTLSSIRHIASAPIDPTTNSNPMANSQHSIAMTLQCAQR